MHVPNPRYKSHSTLWTLGTFPRIRSYLNSTLSTSRERYLFVTGISDRTTSTVLADRSARREQVKGRKREKKRDRNRKLNLALSRTAILKRKKRWRDPAPRATALSLRVLHRPNKLLRPISTHPRYKNYLGHRHLLLVALLWSTR